MNVVRAARSRRALLAILLLTLTGVASWSIVRATTSVRLLRGDSPAPFALAYAVAFVLLAWQALLYTAERPVRPTPRQQEALAGLRVVVAVPLYNEDPAVLQACLASLLRQSRPPALVSVVDDGSRVDYAGTLEWFEAAAASAAVPMRWVRTANHGKRHAQAETVRATSDADIYVTVDSDAILDPDAIDEVLKPFVAADVQSVAGVVMAANNKRNLLTRLTDLWFVTGQLVDRSALSSVGSVLVNSGVLAAYRGPMVRENLDSYLNESFFGRRVEFSDDSMLTIFALARGRAVQQPTAFAFTMMPETLDHHLRQYLRWMRGAFIRTWWRFRYLPFGSYAYWGHFVAWVQWALSTLIFLTLFVVSPIVDRQIVPTLVVVPILIGYGQALRYLSFRRTDESFGQQLMTFALSPLVTLWAFFVLRPVRWYGMLTCLRTQWGTREDVEVRLEAA